MFSLSYFNAPRFLLLATLASSLVWASPIPEPALRVTPPQNGTARRELTSRTVSVLSGGDISGFTPFTQFARAAYCDPTAVQSWTCGEACDANSDFQPTLTGGDGSDVPHFFVGYSQSQQAIIVSHEGTDPTQFLSLLTDADIIKASLDPSLFPGAPSNIEVHQGFRDAHQATASQILTEVNNLISSKGATSVIAVGHSLGGALAELDSLFFKLNLPSNIDVRGVTYGTPRVGTPEYASYFDSTVSNFNRINHNLDPVPIVPGIGLGFSHVSGEIHILATNQWNVCSGDDDTEASCTINSVPNIFVSNILDHLGPYNGISLGTQACN